MARRRRPAAAPLDMEPPDWLWGEPMGRIVARAQARGEEDWIAAVLRSRRELQAKRVAWLEERGLVMWEAGGMPWQEYKRIEREEPHRILRRPGGGPS